LECAEAKEKLQKQVEQEERLKNKTGCAIHSPVAVASSF